MQPTPPPPEPTFISSPFARRGQYATITASGGLAGYYTDDLSTITTGETVALHDTHLGRTVIGVVRDHHRDTDTVTVTVMFEEDRFRVLHGTEPIWADWRTYRWHSPATAPHIHAVVRPNDYASPPYTRRYEPTPGRSTAYVDVTSDGGPSHEWLYGSPYRSDSGSLRPWCQHCGMPATESTSPGEAPFFGTTPRQQPTACPSGRTHHSVYIWTPNDHAWKTPSQNFHLSNDYRLRDGAAPLDPFNAAHVDQAKTYYINDTWEWFETRVSPWHGEETT